jgi:hypothetical protein
MLTCKIKWANDNSVVTLVTLAPMVVLVTMVTEMHHADGHTDTWPALQTLFQCTFNKQRVTTNVTV